MSDISYFHEHDLQKVMALFLLNPFLYKDYKMQQDKQGYFFYSFYQFAKEYNNFSDPEVSVYFCSVKKEKPGETNVCGGGGKMSRSSKKYFKDKHKGMENSRNTRIDEFSKKYGICLEPGKDERLFLGVSEIWNKLDRAIELVANSPYSNVADLAYSDKTLASPIPSNIHNNKTLIPLDIRNKVLQKHFNSSRRSMELSIDRSVKIDDEEKESAPATVFKFIPPKEVYEEDW